jgi:hypothetical protein
MNVENLQEVQRLQRIREDATAIRKEAANGTNRVWLRISQNGGHDIDVVTRICGEAHARQCVIEACTDTLVKVEAKLKALGVSLPNPEPRVEGTAEQWKRECGMFQRAWDREIGYPRRKKWHFIDELVLATRDLKEENARLKAEMAKAGLSLQPVT